jgi:ubiquinone biosynthesis UbiH/UbiF/VisC/COQ6 family hydroxylase
MAAVQAMDVSGDAGGHLRFSAYDTGVGELAWIMESSLMACELWETAKRQANITLFSPAKPQSFSTDANGASLTLDDGRELTARLLVGADGRDSWVRQQAGLAAHTTPYGEMGVVANFATEKAHRGTAWQWFRDDGILAYLPLPGKLMSIVWSTPDAHAEELLQLSPEDFARRVAAAGQHVLGDLEVVTPAAGFPLRLIRVPQVIAPRLALVGDAGHGIHPLSGHGINLGYQDAATLAEILNTTPEWQDIGDAALLRRYQRQRREQVTLLQGTTHALNRLFRLEVPGLKPLRNLGLSVTDRFTFAKSALVRYALAS